MGRSTTQAGPASPPGEAEWRWGAELFERQIAFMPYSTSVALRMHSQEREILDKLLVTFGGRVSRISGTWRWLLYTPFLQEFLVGIRPFLTPRDLDRVTRAEALLLVNRERHPTSLAAEMKILSPDVAVRVVAHQKAVEELPLVDPSEVDIRGSVPMGPWSGDNEVLAVVLQMEEGLHLRATDVTQAKQFVAAATGVGLHADAVRLASGQVVVRLAKPVVVPTDNSEPPQ